jgi:hypothetical protein
MAWFPVWQLGTIKHEEVFNDHGHGALMYQPFPIDFMEHPFGVVVTGPRRSMMRGSIHRPYFAVPIGDMMITGCIGLLAAAANLIPDLYEPIYQSITGASNSGKPPWEIAN